jgi:hypothetical protein
VHFLSGGEVRTEDAMKTRLKKLAGMWASIMSVDKVRRSIGSIRRGCRFSYIYILYSLLEAFLFLPCYLYVRISITALVMWLMRGDGACNMGRCLQPGAG